MDKSLQALEDLSLLNSTVTTHAESMKHKNAVLSKKQSKSISSFFVLKNTLEENIVVLSELVATYHRIVHHHSYASQDCGNKLLTKFCPDSAVASKVSCGRTKATSYVVNILGPGAQKKCVVEVKSAGSFGIGSDASNKGNKKTLPSYC